MPRDPRIAQEKILEAADHLFGEQGFDGTTTREIALACKVNKALIHYHFASKEALFVAVLDQYYARLGPVLAMALQVEGSPRERYRNLIDAYVDFLCANANFARMLQREISGGRHVEHIANHMVPPFRAGAAALQFGFPVTREGDLEASQLIISFFGMIAAWFSYAPVVEQLLERDPLAPESIATRKRHLHRMLDILLDALEAQSNHP